MDSSAYSNIQDTMWNTLWKINRSEINYHIANWNQPGYIIPENFLTWPALGNTSLGQAYYLAPFFDNNSDGQYNPSEGDYPWIKGDQAVFCILNDGRDFHSETGGMPLGIEIHVMAYAFDCTLDSALNNTLFMNYRFFNRSQYTYDSTYLGIWVDSDLGNWGDDYVGCDVERGSFYFYNGDELDESAGGANGYGSYIPAQSVTLLSGAYLIEDNFDNPVVFDYYNAINDNGIPYAGLGKGYGDGINDNEKIGMTTFRYYDGTPAPTGNPGSSIDYYNYMTGKWKDGTSIVYGGNGHQYSGGLPAKYMFPGDTDPLGWGTGGNVQASWTEITAGNVPSDRRGVAGMGPFTFDANSVEELDIAFVFGRDYVNQGSQAGIAVMQNRIDAIRSMFENDSTPCGGNFSSGIRNPDPGENFKVFPNPAKEIIHVIWPANIPEGSFSVSLFNILGEKIIHKEIEKPGPQRSITLQLNDNAPGIYFVRIQSGEKVSVKKIILE